MCSSEWNEQNDTKTPKQLQNNYLFYEEKLGQDHVAKFGKIWCVPKLHCVAKHHGKV